MTTENSELLRLYVADRFESAFASLVERHIVLVSSAALRQVSGDVPVAQDVTQAVFCDLARQARRLIRHPSLTGGLYTSTRYLATKTRRTERSSLRTRESTAACAGRSDCRFESSDRCRRPDRVGQRPGSGIGFA